MHFFTFSFTKCFPFFLLISNYKLIIFLLSWSIFLIVLVLNGGISTVKTWFNAKNKLYEILPKFLKFPLYVFPKPWKIQNSFLMRNFDFYFIGFLDLAKLFASFQEALSCKPWRDSWPLALLCRSWSSFSQCHLGLHLTFAVYFFPL